MPHFNFQHHLLNDRRAHTPLDDHSAILTSIDRHGEAMRGDVERFAQNVTAAFVSHLNLEDQRVISQLDVELRDSIHNSYLGKTRISQSVIEVGMEYLGGIAEFNLMKSSSVQENYPALETSINKLIVDFDEHLKTLDRATAENRIKDLQGSLGITS